MMGDRWSWQGVIVFAVVLAAALAAYALGAEQLATLLGGVAAGGAGLPSVRRTSDLQEIE